MKSVSSFLPLRYNSTWDLETPGPGGCWTWNASHKPELKGSGTNCPKKFLVDFPLPVNKSYILALATETLSVHPGSLALGGFSQGAMLSTDLVLHSDIPFAGLALLSGTLISKHEWLTRLPYRHGLPVFQSHGIDDPILAFSMAQQLREHIKTAGLPVSWVEFRGGHEIPVPVLQGLGTFLQAVLYPEGNGQE